MNVTHLFGVYSGGRLNLDDGGYRTRTPAPSITLHSTEGPGRGKGNTAGGGGGGHAGTGGRGDGVQLAGQPYGSLFRPVDYGSAGGYGNHYGKLLRFETWFQYGLILDMLYTLCCLLFISAVLFTVFFAVSVIFDIIDAILCFI